MNRTEDILELNRRIINRNKEKTIDTDGRLVVPKFDMGVTPVWFQQAGVELYSKKEVAEGRVITTRDPNGPMPLAKGHVHICRKLCIQVSWLPSKCGFAASF